MNPNIGGIISLAVFSIGTLMVALLKEIPSFQLGFMAFFIGSLSVMAFEKARGKDIIEGWKQPVSSYGFVAIGVCFYSILLIISFRHAPAFEVNILNYLWPVLLVLFSSLLNKQPLKPVQIFGALIGMLGMVFLFFPSSDKTFFSSIKTGHVLAIIAAFSWAFYSASAKARKYPGGLVAAVMLLSALFYLVCHLIFEQTVWPSLKTWLLLIFFGITRFGYALWDYSIRNGNQILLASLSYFVPLVSTILFIIFGFLPATILVAIGGGLIISSCLIVNADQLRKFVRK